MPVDREPSEGAAAAPQIDPEEVWQEALVDLRPQVTHATYDRWLSGSWPMSWEAESNTWTIAVRNPDPTNWLSDRLSRVVRRALAWLTGGLPEPRVTFVHTPPPPATRRQVPPPGAADAGEENPTAEEAAGHLGRTAPPAGPQGGQASQVWRRPAHPLAWTDLYVKVKLAFRCEALRRLKGPPLSVFASVSLHMNNESISSPGVETIMRETGYGRGTVCSALAKLCSPEIRLLEKLPPRRGTDRYRVRGYVSFGSRPARTPFEQNGSGSESGLGRPRSPRESPLGEL